MGEEKSETFITFISVYFQNLRIKHRNIMNKDLRCIFSPAAVCIDRYTELRVKQFEGSLGEGQGIDPRLEGIVMRMFDRCLKDKRYKQAIGIAFETCHIDVLERALKESVSLYCCCCAFVHCPGLSEQRTPSQ